MTASTKILVYGTLRHGQRMCSTLGLEGRGKYLKTLRIHGSMYDLGAYPGVKLDGNPTGIVCDLFELDCTDTMDRLDGYEGYNPDRPEGSLYLRQLVEVPDVGAAYIYEYNQHVKGGARVESGDWLARN